MRADSRRGGDLSGAHRVRRALLVLMLVLSIGLAAPTVAWAGPVDWQELPATADGRQWWDAGSLRLTRSGHLSVLSRFQPSPGPRSPEPSAAAGPGGSATAGADPAGGEAAGSPRRRPSDLYVMEIDCDQRLFRDTSINGLPQWGSQWQPVGGDGLIDATVAAVCEAGGPLLASR